MLPPIRAVSWAEPASTAPLASAVKPLAVSHGTIASEGADPVSGGRLGAMSLSAQLQMAQGFSIFAETLGVLLSLPREPNENLETYAQRLATAIQTLDPAQRALLERALNQLADGTSLRLLAEILKNPSGPEAARLAAALEMGQLAAKDLATSTAVTSYIQNEQAQAPTQAVSQTAANPAPGRLAPVPTANGAALPPAITASPPVTAAGEDGVAMPLPARLSTLAPDDAPVPSIKDSRAGLAASLAAPPRAASAMPMLGISTPLPSAPTDIAVTASVLTAPSMALPVAPTVEVLLAQAPPETSDADAEFQTIKAWARAVADVLAKMPSPISLAASPSVPTLGDGGVPAAGAPPTPTAMADATAAISGAPAGAVGDSEDAFAAARGLGKNAVLAMTAWLADVLTVGPLPAPLRAPAAGAAANPEQDAADGLIKHLLGGRLPGTETLGLPQHPLDPTTTASTPPQSVESERLEGEVAHASAASASKTSAAAEASQPPPVPLPLIVPREGVPAAFVPYPPATEHKRNRDGRRTKEVTKIDGEDEEAPFGGQHGSQDRKREERPPGDEPDGEASENEAPEQSEHARRAQDLYLRMANWS